MLRAASFEELRNEWLQARSNAAPFFKAHAFLIRILIRGYQLLVLAGARVLGGGPNAAAASSPVVRTTFSKPAKRTASLSGSWLGDEAHRALPSVGRLRTRSSAAARGDRRLLRSTLAKVWDRKGIRLASRSRRARPDGSQRISSPSIVKAMRRRRSVGRSTISARSRKARLRARRCGRAERRESSRRRPRGDADAASGAGSAPRPRRWRHRARGGKDARLLSHAARRLFVHQSAAAESRARSCSKHEAESGAKMVMNEFGDDPDRRGDRSGRGSGRTSRFTISPTKDGVAVTFERTDARGLRVRQEVHPPESRSCREGEAARGISTSDSK